MSDNLVQITKHQNKLIKEFQCSGCGSGSDPKTCGVFKLQEAPDKSFYRCISHTAGTRFNLGPNSLVYLGMPAGFNKVGATIADRTTHTHIRIHPKEVSLADDWDRFNVPVWAMEKDGFLFVRTYLPRVNNAYIDIYAGKKFSDLPPGVINVAEFVDDID